MQQCILEVTDSIRVKVYVDDRYGFLITNKEAGFALNLEESTVRSYKAKKPYREELEEGLHHINMKLVGNGGMQTTNVLTQAGVIRFAELLGGQDAKKVENWAKQYSTKKEIAAVSNSERVKQIAFGILMALNNHTAEQSLRHEVGIWVNELVNLKIEE